jgi:transposase
MNAATLQDKDNAVEPVLYIAMELSSKQWKLVLADGVKRRRVTIEAGDLAQLGEAITKAKEKFGLPGDVRVVSCYEAGRDGFWLHR